MMTSAHSPFYIYLTHSRYLPYLKISVILIAFVVLVSFHSKGPTTLTNFPTTTRLLPGRVKNRRRQLLKPQISTFHPLNATRFTVDPDAHLYNETNAASIEPLSLTQTCHRALASPIGHASSDGMGHRMTMIVYELNLAAAMNVAYLHRVSPYGSLTNSDPDAIQRLFGWSSYEDKRDFTLYKHCELGMKKVNSSDPKDAHVFCASLKESSPFKHLVALPQRLTDCFLDRTGNDCMAELADFSAKHPLCGTLFQAYPSRSSFDYRNGNGLRVDTWLRARYWQAHASSTVLSSAQLLNAATGLRLSQSMSRVLPFRANRLQIAVHVRRGDFFKYTDRKILSDRTYGAVVVTAIKVARNIFGGGLGIDVSVFSEGAPWPGSGIKKSNHDTVYMSGAYLTEKGTRKEEATIHWRDVIRRAAGPGDKTGNVKTTAFIATDTVTAMHTMMCADVFVGSFSGLSTHVAARIGRGVMLLPAGHTRTRQVNRRIWFQVGNKKSSDGITIDHKRLRTSLKQVVPKER